MASAPRKSTIYFDPEIHRALRMKSAASDRSISEVVNEAVKLALAEDAEDLIAFDSRAREPALDLGKIVKALRRRGKI